MEKEGYDFNVIDSTKAKLVADKINYAFSRNEKNNLLWVHKRLVEAGALNDGDWQNQGRVPDALKADLRIIYRSAPYPRALELVSATLAPERAEALKNLLLSMTPSTHGKLLSRYEKTSGFEALNDNVPQLLAEIYNNSRNWAE